MSTAIDIRDLPGRFAEAMRAAEAGGEVILTDGAGSRARLVPYDLPSRLPGLHPGAIMTSADFDAPLPDDVWAGAAAAPPRDSPSQSTG